jgi:predicted PurR-regulated permease PerM
VSDAQEGRTRPKRQDEPAVDHAPRPDPPERSGSDAERDVDRPRPELAPGSLRISDGNADVAAVALRTTLVVLGVLLLLALAYQLSVLLLMVVVALIVASAMHAPALAIERRGLPRSVAVALAYLALIAVVLLGFGLVAQPLAAELDELTERGPELLGSLRDQAVGFVDDLAGPGTGDDLVDTVTDSLAQLEVGGLVDLPLRAAEILINTLFIVFLSALLVMERDRARRWVLPFLAPERREAAEDVARAVFTRLGRFVHGQLLIMTIVGVGTAVALLLVGVPFALPLGLFAFMVEAIPLLGPWIAAVPITVIAFAQSPVTGLIIVVWLIVLQQIEGLVLTPAVQGKVQHLSPAVVLLSVLAGHHLFGVVGALIAVPVVSAVSIVVERVIRPARERSLARKEQAHA